MPQNDETIARAQRVARLDRDGGRRAGPRTILPNAWRLHTVFAHARGALAVGSDALAIRRDTLAVGANALAGVARTHLSYRAGHGNDKPPLGGCCGCSPWAVRERRERRTTGMEICVRATVARGIGGLLIERRY